MVSFSTVFASIFETVQLHFHITESVKANTAGQRLDKSRPPLPHVRPQGPVEQTFRRPKDKARLIFGQAILLLRTHEGLDKSLVRRGSARVSRLIGSPVLDLVAGATITACPPAETFSVADTRGKKA